MAGSLSSDKFGVQLYLICSVATCPYQFVKVLFLSSEPCRIFEGYIRVWLTRWLRRNQIAELDELRKKGIVTEAEFQVKKAELLKKM